MKEHIFPALKLTFTCMVFFSGIYTLCILGIAQLAPNHGKGEMISYKGQTFYANIAQNFSQDNYFSSRPSACDYNAAGSCGSNKGPCNPDYLAQVQARIDTFLAHNPGITKAEIPSDLVTASGAGLDPDISVQAARVQVPRIARIRNRSEKELYALIDKTKDGPFLGPEKVNVLKLNVALNAKQ